MKQPTSKGPVYAINAEYPLVKMVSNELDEEFLKYFRILLKSINKIINKQRYTDTNQVDIISEEVNLDDILSTVKKLLNTGLAKNDIYDIFLKDAGFHKDKLPKVLKEIL